MATADPAGLPVATGIAGASQHEFRLADERIDNGSLDHAPDSLIGDRAYDSDALDERLRQERGIELIAFRNLCRFLWTPFRFSSSIS
jgi:hypothetical protein